MDPVTGLSYSEPAPHNFSFNSPQGACPGCKGLGYVNIIDKDKIIPDASLSIYQGGILPLGMFCFSGKSRLYARNMVCR